MNVTGINYWKPTAGADFELSPILSRSRRSATS